MIYWFCEGPAFNILSRYCCSLCGGVLRLPRPKPVYRGR